MLWGPVVSSETKVKVKKCSEEQVWCAVDESPNVDEMEKEIVFDVSENDVERNDVVDKKVEVMVDEKVEVMVDEKVEVIIDEKVDRIDEARRDEVDVKGEGCQGSAIKVNHFLSEVGKLTDVTCKFIQVNSISKEAEAVGVDVNVDGKSLLMEVDTGSQVSLIHKQQCVQMFPNLEMYSCNLSLKGLEGGGLQVVGSVIVQVKNTAGKIFSLKLIVCDLGNMFVPLLGREWLDAMVPGWRQVMEGLGPVKPPDLSYIPVVKKTEFTVGPEIKALIDKYPEVFSNDRSQAIRGYKASIVLKEDAKPICVKYYDVAYSIKPLVTNMLRAMIQEGRFELVDRSEWASPLFPIPKPDSSLRLVVNYRPTVNKQSQIDHYPPPKPDNVFASIAKFKVFCVLDLSEAYLQLELDEESQKLLTISTHLGYIRPKRLMYGVASAPGIFQKMMDSILQGLDGVICYIDDVLIGACDRPQALLKLNEVLKRFQDHNLRVNLHKCIFLKESVEYLGFRISGLGVFPINKRVEPILQAPPPRDPKSLRSYIAMLNFYRRFLKNLSDVIKPLTRLLQQGVPWEWSEDCQRSFDTSKKMLLDSDFLVHYDLDKPLVLVCDASKVGVGAYIAHRIDGKEYPIYFASATLNDAQRRYSQVEREAFAINFGLTKFRQYLLGKEFYLVTDNYPLKAILSPSRPVSLLISNRLHNYAMTTSCYKFIPEYRNTSLMGAADLLSRLPLDEKILEEYSVKFVNLDTSEFAVTYETVAQETTKDQTLSKVLEYSSTGWPGRVREVADPLLRPFF